MINNEGKGQLLIGLQTKAALWPLLDLYGKVEEVTVIDDEEAEKGAEIFLTGERDREDNANEQKKTIAGTMGYAVTFHSTHGKNVKMDSRRMNAKRCDSFWNSLTFTEEPLKNFDITFMEVTKVESNYAGVVASFEH